MREGGFCCVITSVAGGERANPGRDLSKVASAEMKSPSGLQKWASWSPPSPGQACSAFCYSAPLSFLLQGHRWSQLPPSLSLSWLRFCVLTGNGKFHFSTPNSRQQKAKWGCLWFFLYPRGHHNRTTLTPRQLGRSLGLPVPAPIHKPPSCPEPPHLALSSPPLSVLTCGGGNIMSSHWCPLS